MVVGAGLRHHPCEAPWQARWVTLTGPPLGVAAGTTIHSVVTRARVIRSHAEVATFVLWSAAEVDVVPAWPCPPMVPRGAS